MSRILVATVPVIGHIVPILPPARGLIARGHEVRWYSGRKHASRIEATGARFVNFAQAYDYYDLKFDIQFAGRSKLKGLDQLRFEARRGCNRKIARQSGKQIATSLSFGESSARHPVTDW